MTRPIAASDKRRAARIQRDETIGVVEIKTPSTGTKLQTKTMTDSIATSGMPSNSSPISVSTVLMTAIAACASIARPSRMPKRAMGGAASS